MVLYRAIELPSDEPVQYVGCYVLKWGKVEHPTVGFVEVAERDALRAASEALAEVEEVTTQYSHKLDEQVRFQIPDSILEAMSLEGWNAFGIYELVRKVAGHGKAHADLLAERDALRAVLKALLSMKDWDYETIEQARAVLEQAEFLPAKQDPNRVVVEVSREKRYLAQSVSADRPDEVIVTVVQRHLRDALEELIDSIEHYKDVKTDSEGFTLGYRLSDKLVQARAALDAAEAAA